MKDEPDEFGLFHGAVHTEPTTGRGVHLAERPDKRIEELIAEALKNLTAARYWVGFDGRQDPNNEDFKAWCEFDTNDELGREFREVEGPILRDLIKKAQSVTDIEEKMYKIGWVAGFEEAKKMFQVKPTTCPECDGEGWIGDDTTGTECALCINGTPGTISERHAGWLEAAEWYIEESLSTDTPRGRSLCQLVSTQLRKEAARQYGNGNADPIREKEKE